MEPEPSHRWGNLLALALAVIVMAGVLKTGPTRKIHYSLEAQQRAAVAEDVVRGTSRGNQGLVGSLYLAPLPTVLAILVSLLPTASITPALSSIVAAGAAVLLACYVNALWRRHGVMAWLRYPAMLCLLLFSPVAMSVQDGRSHLVFVALTVCASCALVEWLRRPALGRLALSAILFGLAVITRYQAVLLVAAAACLVGVAVIVRHRSWSRLEGTIITFVLPTCYTILLWIGGNWLILGSPLFFIKAVSGPLALGTMTPTDVLTWDCPWLLLGALSAFACAVPFASAVAGSRRRGRPVDVAAGLALIGVAAAAWLGGVPVDVESPPLEARHVVAVLRTAYPNGTFIVTGYTGYRFVEAAAPDPNNHWVHVMHLEPADIEKVLDDYRGREVYLLINAADSLDRWDEVNLNWRLPGSRIPERFLFATQVGDWTVFEILGRRG